MASRANNVDVLFIQKYIFAYASVMALSGYIKKFGYSADIIIESVEEKNKFINLIRAIKPKIIAFSLMSTDHKWFMDILKEIRTIEFERKPLIIVGGCHAILYYEDLLKSTDIDMASIGEGEITLLQIIKYYNGEIAKDEITGIAYLEDGNTKINRAKVLVDVNSFNEDRDIYYSKYNVLSKMSIKVFFSSRGCPFRCKFCVNGYLLDNCYDRLKNIRQKDVPFFINEVKKVKERYGFEFAYFADDLFVLNKKWIHDFSELYQKERGSPFMITCRVDLLSDELVKALSRAGCFSITCGVETGNEHMRRFLLNKDLSNEQIEKAVKIVKRHGILCQTSNMFCLPDETIADAIETVNFNIKIGTSFSMSSIYMPFPKTDLAEYCIEKGYLDPSFSYEDIPVSFISKSVLKLKDKDIIANIQKVSSLAIQYPKLKNILIILAKYLNIYYFHMILFLIGVMCRFKKERNASWIKTIIYMWSYRKSV